MKKPDFVIRRSDNTYVVVEIETPAKSLVTGSGQLSAEVTHAEKQVVEYKNFLVQRFLQARESFPAFDEPDCLVVIGLEHTLSDEQRRTLRDANRQRNRVRIVGFDELLHRAEAVLSNVIETGIEVSRLRME